MPRGLPPSPLEKMYTREKLKLVGPIDVDLGKAFDELSRAFGIPDRRNKMVAEELAEAMVAALVVLHAAGRMHNRMLCPTCQKTRQRPGRICVGEPWRTGRKGI